MSASRTLCSWCFRKPTSGDSAALRQIRRVFGSSGLQKFKASLGDQGKLSAELTEGIRTSQVRRAPPGGAAKRTPSHPFRRCARLRLKTSLRASHRPVRQARPFLRCVAASLQLSNACIIISSAAHGKRIVTGGSLASAKTREELLFLPGSSFISAGAFRRRSSARR